MPDLEHITDAKLLQQNPEENIRLPDDIQGMYIKAFAGLSDVIEDISEVKINHEIIRSHLKSLDAIIEATEKKTNKLLTHAIAITDSLENRYLDSGENALQDDIEAWKQGNT